MRTNFGRGGKFMKLRVNVADATDLAELVALERASFASDRITRRSFRRLVRAPSVVLLVCRSGIDLAGYGLVFFRRENSIARLYSIAVAPSYRGQGVAGQLLARMETEARARGCDRFRLEVNADNSAAIHLYRRLGFRTFARIEGYYGDGGDALRMQKDLSQAISKTGQTARPDGAIKGAHHAPPRLCHQPDDPP